MKLLDIKGFKPATIAEAKMDVREFTVEKWDSNGLNDIYVGQFDVLVQYEYIAGGSNSHDYGDTTADEPYDASAEVIKLTAAEEVQIVDLETQETEYTYPAGTELHQIFGTSLEMDKYFKELAIDDAQS